MHLDLRMERNHSLLLGLAAGFTAAFIGAAWQVATRYGVTTSLKASDIALLRYGVPALLLCPWLLKHGVLPNNAPRGWLVTMICGGGFVYGALAISGARFSPTAHMGILLSGTMPLFTALLIVIFLKESFERRRIVGYALIFIGAVAFGFTSARMSLADVWIGDLLFLCASFAWALYTVAFRKLTLSPWYATAVVCFWSAIAAAIWSFAAQDSMLLRAPVREVVFQVALQGIVAGLLGSYVFVVSVRKLGASNAAIFGALVPVLSALGGYLVLAERITMATALTLVVVVLGIVLARQRAPKQ
jgi:drug/metabolite transporter (DMT)-like permease